MKKRLLIAGLVYAVLTACSGSQDIKVTGKSSINPQVLQQIDVSDRQSILFGHYEHLTTAYGLTFEGCCVFDANRLQLANYIVRLFESSTNESFGSREMLIGTVNDKIWVYIVPKALTETAIGKSYVIELDRTSGEVESFKLLAKNPMKS